MSQQWPFRSAWDDPNVKAALRERGPSEVSVICCRECGNFGYYNDGSHFTCSVCQWRVRGDGIDELIEEGEVHRLDDLVDADMEDMP